MPGVVGRWFRRSGTQRRRNSRNPRSVSIAPRPIPCETETLLSMVSAIFAGRAGARLSPVEALQDQGGDIHRSWSLVPWNSSMKAGLSS